MIVATRWLARLVGGFILTCVGLEVISSGLPNPAGFTRAEGLLMSFFLVALVGFAVLWKWELFGGLVVISAMAGFYLAEYLASGSFPRGWPIAAFFVPGVLAVLTHCLAKRQIGTIVSTG